MEAIVAANYTTTLEKEVYVPWNHTFHMYPIRAYNFTNITFTIDGTIKLSKNHHKFPLDKKDKIYSLFDFEDIENIKFQGVGTIDGQGYMWWVREYISRNPHGRPHLIKIRGALNLEFTGIRWVNSPMYHLDVRDMDGFYAHDFEIFVDYKGQLELGRLLLTDEHVNEGSDGITLPMYALNTDGIDPAGRNILIERINITNYDDAVAIKNSNSENKHANCTENVIVRDCTINFGVGMTIGSVIPNDYYACIRNVTFRNHTFHHPFKAIYVKWNPAKNDTVAPGSMGLISDITYEDIVVHRPLWWSIYISTQQQKQPGSGDGPGCMLFPLGDCEVPNVIDVRNITLRNVQQYGTIFPPGVIRCNETNPCTGFVFDNVRAHGWWRLFGMNYIVENVEGEVINSHPKPDFKSQLAGEVV